MMAQWFVLFAAKMALFIEKHNQPQPHDKGKRTGW